MLNGDFSDKVDSEADVIQFSDTLWWLRINRCQIIAAGFIWTRNYCFGGIKVQVFLAPEEAFFEDSIGDG